MYVLYYNYAVLRIQLKYLLYILHNYSYFGIHASSNYTHNAWYNLYALAVQRAYSEKIQVMFFLPGQNDAFPGRCIYVYSDKLTITFKAYFLAHPFLVSYWSIYIQTSPHSIIINNNYHYIIRQKSMQAVQSSVKAGMHDFLKWLVLGFLQLFQKLFTLCFIYTLQEWREGGLKELQTPKSTCKSCKPPLARRMPGQLCEEVILPPPGVCGCCRLQLYTWKLQLRCYASSYYGGT